MKSQSKSPQVEIVYLPSPWPARFTQIAFVLSLAVVIARATMMETLRDPVEVVPGGDLAPRGAGPTTSLVLDLLACVPAILVLLRRVVERSGYTLRNTISQLLLAILAAWALLSGRWAPDKFAAIVNSFHFVAAAALLWSTAQVVRSWMRLRIVAGVCFGLLLICCAHAIIYKFVDVPDNIRYWNDRKAEELKRRGWEPDSFEAKQFEKQIVGGAMVGFNFSPNTFAAVIVLLTVVSAGVIVQRVSNRDEPGWAIIIGVTFLPALYILYLTGSKTAFATLIIAAGILFAVAKLRAWLARQSRIAYAAGAGAVILAMLAVIGLGLARHSLPGSSLNFRWRYWIGASKLFVQHPIRGVGWSNFGEPYLAFRLPAASEEIRDPHNFLIRGFVELGIIGGALMLAWLARLWWELTRPIIPPPAPSESRSKTSTASQLWLLAMIAAAGITLNIVASLDLSQSSSVLLTEIFPRLLYLGLLFLGPVIVSLRSLKQQEIDDRPAPWILYAMLTGLGVFLIHNLIDFSLAEPGPLMLFALLSGAALGARTPNAPAKNPNKSAAVAALCVALLLWMTLALSLVIPVADAEDQARLGDEAIKGNRLTDAAGIFASAYHHLPVNADYAYRSARALMMSGAPPEKVRAMIETAIAADPAQPRYWFMLGTYERAQNPPDVEKVIRAYERGLALDPNSVSARIEFADALVKLNRPQQAVEDYRRALRTNDALEPADPRRLSAAKVQNIETKITASSR